ncbi:MAG TPA: hypothetical protein VJI13_05025 [Candidatus Norongarragalinales archaeon]|nr:hypothetical protein [Candidatus Norongarragalinales archaeon]
MRRGYQLVLGLVAIVFLAKMAASAIFLTDNTGVAAPSENGTSTLLNVSARMQQYVGFFGVINSTVKINTTVGAPQLYAQPVTSGKIYFVKAGASLSGAIVPALNNTQTDGNFSLTGYYITGNHFVNNGTVCGVASMDHLNTTDNYMVAIARDSGATPNYLICGDIRTVVSTNGLGTTAFQVIVPKTSTYSSYDVYVDLE